MPYSDAYLVQYISNLFLFLLYFQLYRQAELLGTKFRHAMYPDPASGGGVLRLHATYRHDLKIKASDEGRVMKTAAAFTKGLLELEGNLTPILASLVTVEEKDRMMLDKGGNDEIKDDMDRCKEHMSSLLQSDAVMTEELAQKVAPNCPKSLKVCLDCLETFIIYVILLSMCSTLCMNFPNTFSFCSAILYASLSTTLL